MKKIILTIAITLAMIPQLMGEPSEYLVGNIKKKGVRDFFVGFGIGSIHGLANNTIHAKCPKQAGIMTNLVTYWAAECLDYSYGRSEKNSIDSVLWGRALGQCLGESVALYDGKTPHFSFNITMLLAFVKSVLPENPSLCINGSDGDVITLYPKRGIVVHKKPNGDTSTWNGRERIVEEKKVIIGKATNPFSERN